MNPALQCVTTTPPVAVTGFLSFPTGLITRIILLCAVCWLAVNLAVDLAAALIQPIRDVFEGALDSGHQRLNSFQLLRGGVDGGVFRHDVAVIVTKGTEGPLNKEEKNEREQRVSLCLQRGHHWRGFQQ